MLSWGITVIGVGTVTAIGRDSAHWYPAQIELPLSEDYALGAFDGAGSRHWKIAGSAIWTNLV